jgi:DNA-binding beta-propeller fold protein YncE
MSLFPMKSSQVRALLAQAGAALAAAVLIAGCGNNYRPVVTPVNTTGPAAQVTSYAVVVSDTGVGSPGVATIIDYSGDSVLAEAPIGIEPTAFTIDEVAGTGYTYNSDHTITNFPISTQLQQKLETVTTLPAGAAPINILAPSTGLWIGDIGAPTPNVVDLFSGSPQTFKESIPMAPATIPAFIAGSPTGTGQREYVINQNIPSSTGVECNVSPTTQPDGTAVPVEISNFTLDAAIALDPFAASTGSSLARCPVFAVQSPDLRRLFVLNRGSDTISVINSQNNSLDECAPFTNQNGQPVTCHPILPLSTTAESALATASANPAAPTGIPITPPNGSAGMGAIAGPVYAEYNQATSQLVVANYDGGTISVIDVSLDQYGNDSPTFGTTYTIPVGTNPASVTVLFDGTRAYTANQGDCGTNCTATGNGTVTIVNLSSHTVEKTLPVTGLPRTVVSTENSLEGKVYAAAPNSDFLTILQTETDLVDTSILIEGNVLDVRTTTQSGAAQSVATYNGTASISNINYSSRVPGYGQPCNLPPSVLGTSFTLAQCQAIP